jgi:periplasmic divalent cation tolerance protein
MKTKYILILTTTSSKEEAESIAGLLLEKKLAACINIVDNLTSIYIWKDKKEKGSECFLLIKSKQALLRRIKDVIKEKHSYDVPEILTVKINGGNKEYLDWMDSCLL